MVDVQRMVADQVDDAFDGAVWTPDNEPAAALVQGAVGVEQQLRPAGRRALAGRRRWCSFRV